MEKKEKARHKQIKVNLFEIRQDRSHGKEVSHTYFVTLVNQVKSKGRVSNINCVVHMAATILPNGTRLN